MLPAAAAATIWSEDEHRRFIEGVQLYQRDWARVAAHVRTKSEFEALSHAQLYASSVPATAKGIAPLRPKRKSAVQLEKERALAENKKPEKKRHWYSLYQNLDPEQLRRQNVASFSVIPTREKLPAPPPSTPNYSGRPASGAATGEPTHSRGCAILNGYGSPSRSVSLTSTIQAAAAAAHNAASSAADRGASASEDTSGAGAGSRKRTKLTGHPCLQPSSFGRDAGQRPMARKRQSLSAADLGKRVHAMDIEMRTPQLCRAVLNSVAAPQATGDDSAANGDCDDDVPDPSRTLAIPLPHRDLAAPALQFVPRQRDRAGAAAELELACYPTYHVAQRDNALSGAFPDAKRVHSAMLDASEELRLRSLAVAFAEVCDKGAFDWMDCNTSDSKSVPFPRWLCKQGTEGTCAVPRPMKKADGEAVRVLRECAQSSRAYALQVIVN